MKKLIMAAMVVALSVFGITEEGVKRIGVDGLSREIAAMKEAEWVELLVLASKSNDARTRRIVLQASGDALGSMKIPYAGKSEIARRLISLVNGLNVSACIDARGDVAWRFFFASFPDDIVIDLKTDIITKGAGTRPVSSGASRD